MDKKLVAAAGKEFGSAMARCISEIRASHGDTVAEMTSEIVRETLTHSVILAAIASPEYQEYIEHTLRNRLLNFVTLVARAYTADKSTAYTAFQQAVNLAKQLREYLDVLATDVTIDEAFKGTE